LEHPRRDRIPEKSINPAWRFLLPIFAVWLLLYGSYALSRPSLPDGPGTIHAEIAREMVARHDWTTAYVNGLPFRSSSRALDWSIAASYELFGVSDWSARLPIALCVLGLAVIVFFFGRKLFVWNAAGLYAALIVLCWPGTFLATRDLTGVPLLCLETTLIAFALWYLLVMKRLSIWMGITVSVLACPLVLLTGNWPAMVLPLAIAGGCWIARRQQTARPIEWFLIAWGGCAYFFADLLEAQPHNLLAWICPVPPLALLLGGWLASSEAFADQKKGQRAATWIVAVALAVSVIAIFFAIHGPAGFAILKLSVVITGGSSRIPLLILAASLIAGAIGNLIFRLRNKTRVANCFLAGMLAGVTVSIQAGRVISSPGFSSQILADAIRPELESTDVVVIDGKYPEASSFAFYLQRPILFASPPSANLPALASNLPASAVAVEQVWSGATRVYLWTRVDHPLAVPGPSYVVAASGGKEILSNQPNSGGAAF